MSVWLRVALLCGCGLVGACFPTIPPQKRVIQAPTLSCEEANHLSYQTVTTLGYAVVSLQVARPGQPGYISARREDGKSGYVTITCGESGAVVIPEKTGVPIPSFVNGEGMGDWPPLFNRTFDILRNTKEVVAQRGPVEGMTISMTRLNSFEAQVDFGADLLAGGILPIKVILTNNTSRPYGFDAGQVFLMSTSGGRVKPIAAPASGQGKALQGEMTIAPRQTVTGYLFYPAGSYTSARTTVVDKENDEGEGIQVQF